MLRKKEINLLTCLRKNGRMSLTSVSKMTRIPVSTLFEKLRRYNGPVIKRTTILIDFEALGYNTRASIFLRTKKQNREELEEHLMGEKHINNLYKITNGWDFLVEAVFKNLQEFHEFVDILEEQYPLEKQIHFILGDLKKEAFLTQSGDKTLQTFIEQQQLLEDQPTPQ